MTVNISLPRSMYKDAETAVKDKHYMSFSEFVRDAIREFLYPKLTENGFTREVEEEILRRAASPTDNDVVWDGKSDPVDFALGYDSPPKSRAISKRSKKTSRTASRTWRDN